MDWVKIEGLESLPQVNGEYLILAPEYSDKPLWARFEDGKWYDDDFEEEDISVIHERVEYYLDVPEFPIKLK